MKSGGLAAPLSLRRARNRERQPSVSRPTRCAGVAIGLCDVIRTMVVLIVGLLRPRTIRDAVYDAEPGPDQGVGAFGVGGVYSVHLSVRNTPGSMEIRAWLSRLCSRGSQSRGARLSVLRPDGLLLAVAPDITRSGDDALIIATVVIVGAMTVSALAPIVAGLFPKSDLGPREQLRLPSALVAPHALDKHNMLREPWVRATIPGARDVDPHMGGARLTKECCPIPTRQLQVLRARRNQPSSLAQTRI